MRWKTIATAAGASILLLTLMVVVVERKKRSGSMRVGSSVDCIFTADQESSFLVVRGNLHSFIASESEIQSVSEVWPPDMVTSGIRLSESKHIFSTFRNEIVLHEADEFQTLLRLTQVGHLRLSSNQRWFSTNPYPPTVYIRSGECIIFDLMTNRIALRLSETNFTSFANSNESIVLVSAIISADQPHHTRLRTIDIESGRELNSLEIDQPVTYLSDSIGADCIFVGTLNGAILQVNMPKLEIEKTTHYSESPIVAITAIDDIRIAVVNRIGHIWLVNSEEGNATKFDSPARTVDPSCLGYLKSRNLLIAGYGNGTIAWWWLKESDLP